MRGQPEDLSAYWEFTGPQQRDKALHTLVGLLEGIGMDRVVNVAEVGELRRWLDEHEFLARRDSVFIEIIDQLRHSMADGLLTPEEIADLVALGQRAESESTYQAYPTNRIRELHGILHGIVADQMINAAELNALQSWLGTVEDIRHFWPISEVESVIVEVMRDGQITAREHSLLMAFFSEFADLPARNDVPPGLELLPSLCAVDPVVDVEGRSFCLTGGSSKAPRSKIAELIEARGGAFNSWITKDLNYLIVCDAGNPCWAFACYGRKVEKAVEYRRQGHPIVIIAERDFWDALQP